MSQDAAAGFASRQRKVGGLMSRGKTEPSSGKSIMICDASLPADSGTPAARSRTTKIRRGVIRRNFHYEVFGGDASNAGAKAKKAYLHRFKSIRWVKRRNKECRCAKRR
jgi:hypothetical protein